MERSGQKKTFLSYAGGQDGNGVTKTAFYYLCHWITSDRGGHKDVDKVAPRLGQDVIVGGNEPERGFGEDQAGFFKGFA